MKRVIILIIAIALLFYVEKCAFQKLNPLYHQELLYFPTSTSVKISAFGYDNFAADLIWIKSIEYYGGHRLTDRNYPYLYRMLDVLTTLDKYFLPAYTLGGVLLVADAKAFKEGTKILIKGFHNLPDRWELPFTLGIINFLYKRDWKTAAKWFYVASKYPNTYPHCVSLASYCLQKGYTPDKGIELWENIYKRPNKLWKEKAIEGVITILNWAIVKYKKERGGYPERLINLVKEGYIKRLPNMKGAYFVLKNKRVEAVW